MGVGGGAVGFGGELGAELCGGEVFEAVGGLVQVIGGQGEVLLEVRLPEPVRPHE